MLLSLSCAARSSAADPREAVLGGGKGSGMKTRARQAQPVGTLSKTLQILELICDSPKGLRLKEISEKTGFNKSTAYRFLAHLEKEGYLVRNGSPSYLLGIKFMEMAARGNWVEGLRSIAWPLLLDLQRATSETVNLAILDVDSVLYVEVLESPHAFRLVSRPGMKRPLHCTSLGKALLAYLPASDQERLLNSLTLERQTARTITSQTGLRKEIAKIRERGYAVDDEEVNVGARCVGAPVLDSREHAIASISLAGPVSRITRSKTSSLAKALQSTAIAISARIGRRAREKGVAKTVPEPAGGLLGTLEVG
jgi:IclR family KDG regulon transcriptional repressor